MSVTVAAQALKTNSSIAAVLAINMKDDVSRIGWEGIVAACNRAPGWHTFASIKPHGSVIRLVDCRHEEGSYCLTPDCAIIGVANDSSVRCDPCMIDSPDLEAIYERLLELLDLCQDLPTHRALMHAPRTAPRGLFHGLFD